MIIMIHLYLRLTQKFVGGALSSLAGMQSFYTAATKAAKATDATTFAKKCTILKRKQIIYLERMQVY